VEKKEELESDMVNCHAGWFREIKRQNYNVTTLKP
jgi:hypothetical protein